MGANQSQQAVINSISEQVQQNNITSTSAGKNIPIGNWTSYVQSVINGKETASFIVGQSGGGTVDPAAGCQKRFTSTYQCGTGSTKEVNISPEAWGQAALFDCTAENKMCSEFRLTLGDDGNIVVTNSTNRIIWSSNTSKTGLALPQYSAKNGKNGRNYLLAGEVLNVGEFIGSPSGNCYLIMVADTGLQLLYNMSGCTMTDENTGVSSDDNSYATYSIPQVNVTSVGKAGYINNDGKLHEYPSELLGLGTTYSLLGNYNSAGNDIKQISNSATATAAAPVQHLDNLGKSLTWEASNAYAQSKGGRLATMAELLAYMTSKGGVLLPGQDQWVAVSNGFNNANDWIEIGNSGHPPGISQTKDFGSNAWWYSAGTKPTWNFYVFWISTAAPAPPAAANPSSTFLNQCEQACNELDNCTGFVSNSDTCWLKNSGMFPTGLRQPDNDYELYTRNKTVKNNNSCSKTVENSTATKWVLFPIGEKMTIDTLCGLGAITEQERNELETKKTNLSGIATMLGNKLQSLTKEKSKIDHSMKMNTGKLKTDMNNYKNVWKQSDHNIENADNISGMLQDTDLNMVSQNYKHLLWTILAIMLIIGGIRLTRT
jgi:hypothetical protein